MEETSEFAVASYAQQGEDRVLERILTRMLKLENEYKGRYVDIGAYHPEKFSITKFLYDEGWRGVCVDINPHTCKLFEEQRPRDVSICAAIGEHEGEVEAYYVAGVMSVMNTCDERTAERMRSKGRKVVSRIIPALTFDTIMHNHWLEGEPIDFVNIDVEGYEMAVLNGIRFDKYSPKIIAIEIHAPDMEAALQTDVAKLLKSKGYSAVACCVITYFFILSDSTAKCNG